MDPPLDSVATDATEKTAAPTLISMDLSTEERLDNSNAVLCADSGEEDISDDEHDAPLIECQSAPHRRVIRSPPRRIFRKRRKTNEWTDVIVSSHVVGRKSKEN